MADNFIWYELMTSDQDGAIRFYTDVVGWTAEDQTMAELDFRYTLLSASGRPVAGLMTMPAEMQAGGAPPGWVGVIGVSDTDAAAERIKAAGGSVHMGPDDIPNVGRFAFVADPGGTAFEVMTPIPPEEEMPPLERMTPGNVGWHELYAPQGGQQALDFYVEQFGWSREGEMDMGPMGKYRFFGVGSGAVGATMNKPERMPVGAWQFYFVVDALDAAVERVRQAGGQVLMGPMEVPDGSWIIQGLDPQGAHFALVAAKR
jgi:predicted enzyme related to lactoylglutathione lyase